MLCSLTAIITTTLVPLLLAAIGFGFLVTVHELGHYLFAKAFGFRAPVFSIGFGPVLCQFTRWETEFRLSLIPLGGFCAIEGLAEAEMNLVESNATNPTDDSFTSKSYFKKALVLLGGIGCNMLLAYAAFAAIIVGTTQKTTPAVTITEVVAGSAAEKYGLRPGDHIEQYNAHTFGLDSTTIQEELGRFLQEIRLNGGKKMEIGVARNNDHLYHTVVIGGTETDGAAGSLGVMLEIKETPIPGEFEYNAPLVALRKGIARAHQLFAHTAQSILNTFKHRSLQGMGGPVAMLAQTYKVAKTGWQTLLNFIGIMSISLAVINLMPVVPFDGGQFVIITLEAIIRRPLGSKFKDSIAIAGWFCVLLLFLVLSYRDILRLFGF